MRNGRDGNGRTCWRLGQHGTRRSLGTPHGDKRPAITHGVLQWVEAANQDGGAAGIRRQLPLPAHLLLQGYLQWPDLSPPLAHIPDSNRDLLAPMPSTLNVRGVRMPSVS